MAVRNRDIVGILNEVAAAVRAGARLAIATDAHSTGNLGFMRYGIDTARRGWVEAASVVNTRGLDEVRSLLAPGARRG